MPLSLEVVPLARERDRSEWNARIAGATGESFALYHTTHWADRLADLLGFRPRYFQLCEDGQPRIALVGFTGWPEGGWRPQLRYALRLLTRGRRGFWWYGQPVVWGDPEPALVQHFVTSLKSYLEDHRLHFQSGQWSVRNEELLPSDWARHRWATLKIDLEPSLDELKRNLKPAARKEIRKSEERGVTVERLTDPAAIQAYGRFAVECARARDNQSVEASHFLSAWQFLRSSPFFYETFVARHNGEPIAGLSVWGDQRTVMEMGSFQSQRGFDEKLGGPDLIKWRIIEWAQAASIRYFDLAGISPAPTSPKEENIRRFKEKWGGTYSEYLILSGATAQR